MKYEVSQPMKKKTKGNRTIEKMTMWGALPSDPFRAFEGDRPRGVARSRDMDYARSTAESRLRSHPRDFDFVR